MEPTNNAGCHQTGNFGVKHTERFLVHRLCIFKKKKKYLDFLTRKHNLPSNTQRGEDFFVWNWQECSGVAVASSAGVRLTHDVDCCFNDAFNGVIWPTNHLRSYWPRVFNMRRAPALSFPSPLSTAPFLCSSPPAGGGCSQWDSPKKCLFSLGPALPELIGSRVKVIFLARCLANPCKHLRKGRRLWLFSIGKLKSSFSKMYLALHLAFFSPHRALTQKMRAREAFY